MGDLHQVTVISNASGDGFTRVALTFSGLMENFPF